MFKSKGLQLEREPVQRKSVNLGNSKRKWEWKDIPSEEGKQNKIMESESVKQKSESGKGKKWELGDSIPQEDQGEDLLIEREKQKRRSQQNKRMESESVKQKSESVKEERSESVKEKKVRVGWQHSPGGPSSSSTRRSIHREAEWGNYVCALACPDSKISQ